MEKEQGAIPTSADCQSDGSTLFDEMLKAAGQTAPSKATPGSSAAPPNSLIAATGSNAASKASGAKGPTGFNPGFLLSTSSKATATAKMPPGGLGITQLGPAKATETSRGLVLKEVQTAMEANMPAFERALSKREWMTPELLQKVAADPVLSSGLADPRFLAALPELQKNPQKVLNASKGDAPLLAFLQRFMALLGDHFTQLGLKEQQQEEGQRRAQSAAAVSGGIHLQEIFSPQSVNEVVEAAQKGQVAADDDAVRQVLSNRKLAALLADPATQQLLQECAADPQALAAAMRNKQTAASLRLLAEHGLISFQ